MIGPGLFSPFPTKQAISPGDVLFMIACARQQLDLPTGQSLHVAREMLDSLEFRLVTDCLEYGLDLERRVLA